MTAAHVILFATLALASWTDLRRHRVPNALTYPALIACLVARTVQDGGDGLSDALLGAVACGALVLVAWLARVIGGGDVKLAAVMGAALGWIDGLNALMWTFTLAAIAVLSVCLWYDGISGTWQAFRNHGAMEGSDVSLLPRPIYLAPAALVAVALILLEHGGHLATLSELTSSRS